MDIDSANAAYPWTVGTLNARSPGAVTVLAAGLALGVPLALALGRSLSGLRFSDAVAAGLGVRLRRRRAQVLSLSVLLTALAVAVAGPVGMVGLIGPEIARSLSSPRGVPLIASALAGALVMVLADLVGRLLLAPIELPVGIVTAIVGPNGCGKSTLLAGLARLHAPAGGAVLLDGVDIQRLPARELARRLALLPQEASAPEGLTVGDLVRFGRQPHQGWLRQWSADDRQAVAEALAAAGLEALAERPLEALSGGQRQRAWIAMTIAQQTPLLLLDEPTSALDLGHQLEVFELVRSLASRGRTIALVLHDLASACRYADHLVAMRDGRIVAQGAPAEVVSEALVAALYGVACTLIHDPVSGTPLLTNLRRLL